MNKHLGNGLTDEAKEDYRNATVPGARASDCIACKQCERACPQHIDITAQLTKCADMLEAS